ncbi:hypothetical protein DL96DRAFT_1824513 [Flagelloscypha sp. PMI_526]|nr:hypothetical protein DL96DRAFT_1824513 [Flagelloscypha sp. PMI_526]
MIPLPIDLLPNFLCFLDTTDLEQCCIVTRSFRHVARPLLFTHLVLSSRTWKAKCRILVHTADSHLLQHTTGLTLEVLGMPVFLEDSEHVPLLVSILQMFQGHRLHSFCIDSRREERQWDELNPNFQDAISVSIFPFASSIQLLGLSFIPLLRVLVQCTLLQDIRLGAKSSSIDSSDDLSWEEISVLPGVKSLSFWSFDTSGLDEGTSVVRYIQSEAKRIERLEFLDHFSENYFPLSILSLEHFSTLRYHLLHLSFGLHLHQVIIAYGGTYRSVPIGMFQQLQTVQFTVSDHSSKTDIDAWDPWTEWLATMLVAEIDHTHSLRILRILMHPNGDRRPKSALEHVVRAMNIQIHVCVDGNGKNVDLFEDTVVSVRSSLPAWDEVSRLKFWMRLGV